MEGVMDFDKAAFAAAVMKKMRSEKWTLQEVADMFTVKPPTISNWRNPRKVDKPHPNRWDMVKAKLGIDCADYVIDNGVKVSGERSQGVIIADNGATVNASCDFGSGEKPAMLTKFEYELWELFRKFGNQAIADRCYKQLKAIEAMSTM